MSQSSDQPNSVHSSQGPVDRLLENSNELDDLEPQNKDQDEQRFGINNSEGEQEMEENNVFSDPEPEEAAYASKLQRSSRVHYQGEATKRAQQKPQPSRAMNSKAFYEVFPADKMSRWQVALISSMMAEEKHLIQYINGYLLSKTYYYQEWTAQKKASSFILHWIDLTVPLLTKRLLHGSNHPVPGNNFGECFHILTQILDHQKNIYDYRRALNSTGHLLELKQEHPELFAGQMFVKPQFFEKESYNSMFFLFHLQAFAKAGGFELFLSMLEPLPQGSSRNFRPQIDNMIRIMNILFSVREFLEPAFFEKLVNRFRSAAMDFAANQITEDAMRNITKQQISQLSGGLDRLLNHVLLVKRQLARSGQIDEPEEELMSATYHLENVQKYSDLMQLEFAAHQIKMPVLDKKFAGFAILSQKIKEAKAAEELKTENEAQRMSGIYSRKEKWLTTEYLANWLDEQRVFSLIFEESLHSEVIKKSSFIVEFLYTTGHLGAPQLDLMWESAMKKHEVYKIAILKMIIFVAQKARLPELRHLFDKVKETPLNQVDKFLIILLKTIAKNIASAIDTDQSKANQSKRYQEIMSRKTENVRRRNSGEIKQSIASGNLGAIINNSKPKKVFDDNDFKKASHPAELPTKDSFKEKRAGLSITVDKNNDKGSAPRAEVEVDSCDITNVPKDKQDKKTADEEDSGAFFGDHSHSRNLFDDEEPAEEEKDEEDPFQEKNKLSVQHLLFDPQIQVPEQEEQHKKLAIEVLRMLWFYAQEEHLVQAMAPVNQVDQQEEDQHLLNSFMQPAGLAGNLSMSAHQNCVETLTQVVIYHFPQSIYFFINLCVQNIKMNRSQIASQNILLKLLKGTCFPIKATKNTIPDTTTSLPKNQAELILALDNDLDITNECLASYVEFKRKAVQVIFDQFGNLDNSILGGNIGDQDGDLETQSSLDNNTHQTGEERSRFSKSIISSTQKSDTVDYITHVARSQQKSFQRRSQQPYTHSQHEYERGQSVPKQGILKNKTQLQQQMISEPHSSLMKASRFRMEDTEQANTLGNSGNDLIAQRALQTQFTDEDDIQFKIESGGENSTGNPASDTRREETESSLFDNIGQLPGGWVEGDGISSGHNIPPQKDMRKIASNQDQFLSRRKDDMLLDIAENKLARRQFEADTKAKATKSEIGDEGQHFEHRQVVGSEGVPIHTTEEYFSGQRLEPVSSAAHPLEPSRARPPAQEEQSNRQFLQTMVTNQAYGMNFITEMKERLNFFKYLTVNSNCKTYKEVQTNLLWECLVVNGFNDDERDSFFTFCTEVLNHIQIFEFKQQLKNYQQKGEAGELLFEDDTWEKIFFEILLKLDFKSPEEEGLPGDSPDCPVTTKMYQCFERFFLYINEQYGQIVLTLTSLQGLSEQTVDIDCAPLDFDVYDDQLIGVEALWEIILGVSDDKIYKRASQLLLRLFRKLATEAEGIDSSKTIQEKFFSNCMGQIRFGLNEIQEQSRRAYMSSQFDLNEPLSEVGIHPDVLNSPSIEKNKVRISRSIELLGKFITEFEGKGMKASPKDEREDAKVHFQVTNQIKACWPSVVKVVLDAKAKIADLKQEISSKLTPTYVPDQLQLLYKGKFLNQDLKTARDYGMKSYVWQHGQKKHNPVKINLTKAHNSFDKTPSQPEYSAADLIDGVNTIKAFMGDLGVEDEVLQLALKKCKMKTEETIMMVTDESQLRDLVEEVAAEQMEIQKQDLLAKAEEEAPVEGEASAPEIQLSEMVSNKAECFDLLFDLLNLGVPTITQASWQLLTQVPVNQQLLEKIRHLREEDSQCEGPMSQIEWARIIDPNGVHKMLYSLQLVNQLITINNQKLSESEMQERFQWRKRFLELGGFDHLYYILLTYDFDSLKPSEALPLRPQPDHEESKTMDPKGEDLRKKKKKGQQAVSVQMSQSGLFRQTQSQCLSHLVSIIKIFLEAAMLSKDQGSRLLSIIAHESTSPFRKQKASGAPGTNTSYGGEQMSSQKSGDESDKNSSSVHTPKFANSFASAEKQDITDKSSDFGWPGGANIAVTDENDIFQHTQVQNNSQPHEHEPLNQQGAKPPAPTKQIQVDDFPKLIEQMNKNGIAQNILENVVDFGSFIHRLLQIVYVATNVFNELGQPDEGLQILIQNCLDLLISCIMQDPQNNLNKLTDFASLEQVLRMGLVRNSNEKVRKGIEQNFRTLCALVDEQKLEAPQIKQRLLQLLIGMLPKPSVRGNEMESQFFEEYFNLLGSLIKISSESFVVDSGQPAQFFLPEQQKFNARHILHFCVEMIQSMSKTLQSKLKESQLSSVERIMSGYMQFTQSLLEVLPELKQQAQEEGNLIAVITDFIFASNVEPGASQQKKVLNRQTRKRAFGLVLSLSDGNEANFSETLKILFSFHKKIENSWFHVNIDEFDADVGIKPSHGYSGLKNFGCTCYMNSLFQQLFMTPDFRNHILGYDTSDLEENNVISLLQDIFANLQESEKSYYVPKNFICHYRGSDGQPVNVRIQEDTHEFFLVLCDKIEQLLPKVKRGDKNIVPDEVNFIKQSIGGVFGNQIKSLEKDYDFVQETPEVFSAVQLDIKNKKSIEEALDQLIKPDVLEGENKYFCEKYQKKISIQRRTYLKDLSNTVIFNLKRFEYDYEALRRFKINDYFHFPETINLWKWTREGIDAEEKKTEKNDEDIPDDIDEEDFKEEETKAQAKKGSAIIDEDVNSDDAKSVDQEGKVKANKRFKGGNLSSRRKTSVHIGDLSRGIEPKANLLTEESKKDKFEFQLVGVLVHSGSADSGHYYSYIKERNPKSPHFGKWFEFNDTTVREFDLKNLKAECFGGQRNATKEHEFDREPLTSAQVFERCSNAYLILYERVNKIATPSPSLKCETMKQSAFSRIHKQNQAFKNLKIFSDPDYIKFAVDFVNQCRFQEVLYFDRACSDSVKMQQYRRLFSEYKQELKDHEKKAKRIMETQQLRGEEVKAHCYQESKDYSQEQLEIRCSQVDTDVFASSSTKGEIGLQTIQLASVLAQDILLRLKDQETFVQLVTRLTQMFQAHAQACVWFIIWMSEQQSILQRILLINNQPEIREVFKNLLSTTFSVTVKNEEKYLSDVEAFFDFKREAQEPFHRAASMRFARQLTVDNMMDCARANWRNFDEYFILLKEMAQTHFEVTKFLIQEKGMIHQLVLFVANQDQQSCMGDHSKNPNFQNALDLLAYLIKCCMTCGVTKVQRYSITSIYQQDHLTISLPEEQIQEFFTSVFLSDLLESSPNCSDLQTQAVTDILLHLSWGDQRVSRTFIEFFCRQLAQLKLEPSSLNFLEDILCEMMKLLEDSLKEDRLACFLEFKVPRIYSSWHDPKTYNSIFEFVNDIFDSQEILKVRILKIIARVCLLNPEPDALALKMVREYKEEHADWIYKFLFVSDFEAKSNQAQWNKAIPLRQESFVLWAKIFEFTTPPQFGEGPADTQGEHSAGPPSQPAQDEDKQIDSFQVRDLEMMAENPQDEAQELIKEMSSFGKDEHIFKLKEKKGPNTSFSGIDAFNKEAGQAEIEFHPEEKLEHSFNQGDPEDAAVFSPNPKPETYDNIDFDVNFNIGMDEDEALARALAESQGGNGGEFGLNKDQHQFDLGEQDPLLYQEDPSDEEEADKNNNIFNL